MELGLDERLHRGPHLLFINEAVRDLDVGTHVSVLVPGLDVLAHHRVHRLELWRRLEGPQHVQGLARAQQLNRDHIFDVLHHVQRLARREATHGHVILLRGGGRQRVHGGGVAKHLVLGDEGRGGAVSDHEATVEAARLDEEGRETRELGVDEALDASFGH